MAAAQTSILYFNFGFLTKVVTVNAVIIVNRQRYRFKTLGSKYENEVENKLRNQTNHKVITICIFIAILHKEVHILQKEVLTTLGNFLFLCHPPQGGSHPSKGFNYPW